MEIIHESTLKMYINCLLAEPPAFEQIFAWKRKAMSVRNGCCVFLEMLLPPLNVNMRKKQSNKEHNLKIAYVFFLKSL